MFENLVISDEPFVPNGSVPPDRVDPECAEGSTQRPRRNRAKSKAGRDKSTSRGVDRDKSTSRGLDRDKSTSVPLDRDPSTDRLSSTRGESCRRRPRAESKRRRRASGYRTPRSRSQEDLLDAPEAQDGSGAYNAGFHDNWHQAGSQQHEWWEGYQEGYYGNSYDYGNEPVIEVLTFPYRVQIDPTYRLFNSVSL